ncbi:MAG: DUF4369 domain-containing protein, partial [Muribaculaceae bacterium]|nr:DUF4369 domain-containing protein [Muribaculaceae bacterium]
FKINGTIEGGADRSVVLEKASFAGNWIAVDSAKVNEKGGFEIASARPSAPEIYRLAMGERYIYLPVDSNETLTVTTKASDFGADFTVSGSVQAEKLAQFEKELMSLDFSDAAKREAFKRDVYSKYLKDAQGGILSYYVLTKTVGKEPLYDIQSEADAKYYAAVATAFEQYRPDDPHTRLLKAASIDALKRKNSASGRKRVMEAEEIKFIDLTLPDENGKEVSLSDVMGKGKRGVMIVSLMNEKESPAINKALSDLYAGGNLCFYMISVDADQYAWRDAAKNLPWITVTDPDGRNSGVITKYNIGTLPAFFIFSADGHLVDRAFSLEELNKKL